MIELLGLVVWLIFFLSIICFIGFIVWLIMAVDFTFEVYRNPLRKIVLTLTFRKVDI